MAYLLLGLSLLMIAIPLSRRAYAHWHRKKLYHHILLTLDALYQHVDPFLMSKQERQTRNLPSDYTYGEIDPVALLDLLASIHLKGRDHFIDLGSGVGKAAFTIKLRYPTLEVSAIEELESLHQVAIQTLAHYQESHHTTPYPFEIDFRCDNFLECDFSEATIVFFNATALSEEKWQQMQSKLIQLNAGSKVILTSKKLPEEHFIQLYSAWELMSWGHTSTYIFEKK